VQAGEAVVDYLGRITAAKLRAVAALPECIQEAARRSVGILVADTSVVLEGQILGKPVDVDDCERMLVALAGREHQVMTRYVLAQLSQGRLDVNSTRTETSHVMFRACSRPTLRRYAASGEGADKAGGYAIQGLGSFLVRGLRGSYSNVVGLPACELIEDLERLGWLGDYPR
jgi:septum formation protein